MFSKLILFSDAKSQLLKSFAAHDKKCDGRNKNDFLLNTLLTMYEMVSKERDELQQDLIKANKKSKCLNNECDLLKRKFVETTGRGHILTCENELLKKELEIGQKPDCFDNTLVSFEAVQSSHEVFSNASDRRSFL